MDFTPNFVIYIICWNSEVWCVSVQLLLRSISLQYALNKNDSLSEFWVQMRFTPRGCSEIDDDQV